MINRNKKMIILKDLEAKYEEKNDHSFLRGSEVKIPLVHQLILLISPHYFLQSVCFIRISQPLALSRVSVFIGD